MAPDRQLYIQRQRAKNIANEDYRMSCYEKPGIVDRLSLFQRFGPDTWIAVIIYRDSAQGHFDHSECARLITVAPILTASADKHRHACHERSANSNQRIARTPYCRTNDAATSCRGMSDFKYTGV